MTIIEGERLLTYADLRKRLRCSQRTCVTLATTGVIRSVLVGVEGSKRPRRLFREADVEAFIAARSTLAKIDEAADG